MREARRYLVYTNQPVASITYALGFNDLAISAGCSPASLNVATGVPAATGNASCNRRPGRRRLGSLVSRTVSTSARKTSGCTSASPGPEWLLTAGAMIERDRARARGRRYLTYGFRAPETASP